MTPGATPGDDTSGLIQRQLTDRRARNAAELDAISRAYNKHIYRARRKRAGTDRIHPFINGNGRHARMITDIFFHSVKHPLPKWPQIQLMSEGDQVRSRYIEAMKAADKEDYCELMAFMKEFVE